MSLQFALCPILGLAGLWARSWLCFLPSGQPLSFGAGADRSVVSFDPFFYLRRQSNTYNQCEPTFSSLCRQVFDGWANIFPNA